MTCTVVHSLNSRLYILTINSQLLIYLSMLCSKQFSLSVKLPPYACSLRPPGKFSRLIKESRAVSSEIIGGVGGWWCIFIYSCSARRISFESDCFYGSEHGYMNIHPPPHYRVYRHGLVKGNSMNIEIRFPYLKELLK